MKLPDLATGKAAILVIVLTIGIAYPALAYIGPGAGFALVSSVGVLLVTVLLALLSLLLWPLRSLWWVAFRGRRARAWVRRLIVVGFDGQDAALTERFMAEGKLPNFSRLAKMGCYSRLRSTYPSITPVAWSTFSTGTGPGRHGIFDFLERDRRSYLPLLSSVQIDRVERSLKIGRWRLPLHKPAIRLLRKSKPYWKVLAEHRIWSTILRMPVSFPPERFRGAQLSAMCTPDLLGTQGTFLLYTTRPVRERIREGGIRIGLPRVPGEPHRYETVIQGPDNAFREGNPPLETALRIAADRAGQRTRIGIDGDNFELVTGRLSPWLSLKFRAAPGVTIAGLCRMLVSEADEEFSLYVSPISIDPERPAMPISHPPYYAGYLAKMIGPYSTLGLAEDTWALNEGVIDDATFLEMALDVEEERERMFWRALDRLRRGSLACVFDATDRVQHMFWRYTEEGHPAVREPGTRHADAIEQIYLRNDRLVGKLLGRLGKKDLLLVVSDHGMTSFRRGCNLNRWLHDNGYLALKDGADGSSPWLRDVDWSRTRAYVVGLTGIFLNIRGRESAGVVEAGEPARALKLELMQKLGGLIDEEREERAINEVFETSEIHDGPYLDRGPDLIVGYNHGYRHSWDCTSGIVAGEVFEDNRKAWSADHCVDPRLVPGILFSSCAIDEPDPGLIDMAPTVLQLFGLPPEPYMEGRPLFHRNPIASQAQADTDQTGDAS